MGVHPGKEHQSFIPPVYKKISQIRKANKKIIIQIDGGVNEKNVKKLIKSGANYLNSGSYVSSSQNPKQALLHLNNLSNKLV